MSYANTLPSKPHPQDKPRPPLGPCKSGERNEINSWELELARESKIELNIS